MLPSSTNCMPRSAASERPNEGQLMYALSNTINVVYTWCQYSLKFITRFTRKQTIFVECSSCSDQAFCADLFSK